MLLRFEEGAVGSKELGRHRCGLVVNPEGVHNQVGGSIIMGMGTALREAIEFDAGRLLNPAFSRYRVPRINDAPQIAGRRFHYSVGRRW